MNYLPFCGFWFYGGADVSETASFFCSWGLLAVAPVLTFYGIVRQMLQHHG